MAFQIQSGCARRPRLLAGISIASLMAAASAPGLVHAQNAAPGGQVDEVVVTASRINRVGFTAPTPVTTLDASAIAATGMTTVANVLNDIPAFRPQVTESSSDQRGFSPGAAYADLRGLGSTRTLVLINGERFVPQIPGFSATITQQVDLNVIPTIAVQRTEVVTGGASAAWGSDAIAGVVNMQLYRRYDGLKLDLATGRSRLGDDVSYTGQLLAGQTFLDGKLSAVAAATYDRNEGVGTVFTRDWGEPLYNILLDPSRCATFCYLKGSGWQSNNVAFGGLITNTTLRGIAFGQGGAPYTFDQGYFQSSGFQFGGSQPENSNAGNSLLKQPYERMTSYGYLDYRFNDKVTGRVQVNYSDGSVKQWNSYQNTYTIRSGNPFIPASIQQRMTSGNIASFTLAVRHPTVDVQGERTPSQVTRNRTQRISLGLDWGLGGSWNADAYYTYGSNLMTQKAQDRMDIARAAQAADAILVNGVIRCRDDSNGCIPFNPMGLNTVDPNMRKFWAYDEWTEIRYSQHAAALNLTGEPFDTWAGPVGVAFGVEYRKEKQSDTFSPQQLLGTATGGLSTNFAGGLNVKEAYAEAAVPLLKDLPLVKAFNLSLAGRATDYSTFGGVKTWKVGAVWNVTDELMLRGTRSRDIRAPNLTELYFPFTQQRQVAVQGQTPFADFFNGGNVDLDAEVAKSLVFGATYRPGFIPGLGGSIDYYAIDLDNAIINAAPVNILNGCQVGNDPQSCAQLTIVNGIVTSIRGGFSNISSSQIRGMDVEVSYSTRAPIAGVLTFRALGTFTSKLTYQVAPGQPYQNFAGQTNPGILVRSNFFGPKTRGQFVTTYALGGFQANLNVTYISASKADVTLTDFHYPQNRVPAYARVDLGASYSFGPDDRYEVYGNVRNLLDIDPPFVPNPSLSTPTAAPFYDVVGQTFRIGFRYRR